MNGSCRTSAVSKVIEKNLRRVTDVSIKVLSFAIARARRVLDPLVFETIAYWKPRSNEDVE
jgi:hypothetical protein